MPDASAAEAAERKRVMEAVAHMLDAAAADYDRRIAAGHPAPSVELVALVEQAARELRRTPVGRERHQ